jgi:hypothetical protein
MFLPMQKAGMNALALLLLFSVGAAVLALWVEVRLGERSPDSPSKVMLHAATAWVVVGCAAAIAVMLIDPESRTRTMLALLALVLPSWTYAYLSMMWALKLVARAIPR